MKKHNILSVVLCLVVVLVVLGWKYYPRSLPLKECSEVYKRYSQMEGIRATYIKDFRVNDTLTIGVTLLEATTDSGWARLMEDFAIIPIPSDILAYCDSNTVNMWMAAKRDYSLRADPDLLNNDLIAMNYLKHIISVFHLESENQQDAILHYQTESITLISVYAKPEEAVDRG